MPSITTFFDSSKEVAKKYINTVSYVDDLIYSKKEEDREKTDIGEDTEKENKILIAPNKETVAEMPQKKTIEGEKKKETDEVINIKVPTIDPFQFTSSFIEQGIHCSLIEIQENESENNLDNIKNVLKKSDIVILDWQMHNDGGEKASDLLVSLIDTSKQNEPELKLYIIYTDDRNYKEIIYNKIYPKIKDVKHIENTPNSDDCVLVFGHTKIVVLNKKEELKEEYAVNENNLPTRIIYEFTKMTSGLLSNFALYSLTTIRENVHKILGLYSKELDAAYLGHKVLLPHTEDAEHLLCELFRDSIGDLLFYHSVGNVFDENVITMWLEENIKENDFNILKGDGTAYNPKATIKCNTDNLKKLVSSKKVELIDRFNDAFGKTLNESKLKYITSRSTSLFLKEELQEKEENYDINFAKLTHHKNLFIPHAASPILSLGTILHRIDDGKKDDDEYYICIQQKCDSLRIEDFRKFLFLPLNKPSGKKTFDTLTHDGKKFKIDTTTHCVKTMKFEKTSEKGVVGGKKNDNGQFIFKNVYNEEFEWILDLKDLHSQRIVTQYATQLSRVGLDESEWLRRNAGS